MIKEKHTVQICNSLLQIWLKEIRCSSFRESIMWFCPMIQFCHRLWQNWRTSICCSQFRTDIVYQNKDSIIAEYALRSLQKPIGIFEFELTRILPDNLKSSLPSIEDIENELTKPSEES